MTSSQTPTSLDSWMGELVKSGGKVTQNPYGSFSHSKLNAYDIGGIAEGTPITLPFAGKIVEVDNSPQHLSSASGSRKDYGNSVVVEDVSTGKRYRLGHMAQPLQFQVGQLLVPGSTLGLVGNTGYSTAAHIHLGQL